MVNINRLQLLNFRNYLNLDISFDKNINIFIGDNAQGKTSLLESIYLLSISKSHKTHKDRDIIYFDADFAKVTGEINKNETNTQLELIISNKGKKALIDSLEKKKMSEYIGFFNVVMFAPEDLDIVKREPMNRRKFLDIEIGQISPIYIYHLNQYNKLLKQRNEYLKQVKYQQNLDIDYLDILTLKLADHGYNILLKRKSFVKNLNIYAKNLHYHISNNKEELIIDYSSSYIKANSKEEIFELYKKHYKEDLKREVTWIGIHRDDLIFNVNNIDVSRYGSQGQQRTTALSIKLSLIDFIKNETDEYPIVLLDDVLSELDDTRQTLLLDCIKDKVQTFVTTTNISGIQSEIIKKSDLFEISSAKIIRKEGVYNGN